MSRIRVQCHAGFRGDQRPLQFSLGEQTLKVEHVEDQWYSPSAMYFRVRAADGNLYVLRHDEVDDTWTLDGFRAGPSIR